MFAGLLVFLAGIGQAGRNDPASAAYQHMLAVSCILLGAFGIWSGYRATQPVQTHVSHEIVHRAHGMVTLAIYGTKARKECELLGGEAYVHVLDERAPMRKANTQWPRDAAPGASRPAGSQSFGEWEVSFREPPSPYAVSFRLHHQCGKWLGLTHTDIGPFNIPSPPTQ